MRRILLLVACALLLTACLPGAGYPSQATAALRPPLPATQATYSVIALGDSTMHADGYGSRRWIEQVTRPDVVLSSDGTTRGSGTRWLWDWSHNGYRSTDYAQPHTLDYLPPTADLVVLGLGTNDLNGSSPDEYRFMLAYLLSRWPTAACTIVFPWDWRTGPHPALPFYREAARAVAADRRCKWVDLSATYPVAPPDLAPDGIHPNARGHDAIAQQVVK